MKTIPLFLLLLVSAPGLTSCNGPLQIEKRHYRNGWYIANGRTHETAAAMASLPETPATVVNDEQGTQEVFSANDTAAAPVEINQPARVAARVTPAKTVKAKTRLLMKADAPAADTAQDASALKKKAWTSLGLGAVSVVGSALSPVIFASSFTPVVLIFLLAMVVCAILAVLIAKNVQRATKRGDPARKIAMAGKVPGLITLAAGAIVLLLGTVFAVLWYSL